MRIQSYVIGNDGHTYEDKNSLHDIIVEKRVIRKSYSREKRSIVANKAECIVENVECGSKGYGITESRIFHNNFK
jgi:hypothetical protein